MSKNLSEIDVSRETFCQSPWFYNFEKGLFELGINLEPAAFELFNHYYHLMQKWNQRLNLVSQNDIANLEILHFLDSLLLHSRLKCLSIQNLVDVGTGAGFPGLPLKIASPNLNVTLIEAIRKKTLFLRQFIRETDISGVEVLCSRAEKLPDNYTTCFDVAVARAVASLKKLIPYAIPLIRRGGIFFAYKGNPDFEIKEASKVLELYGAEIESVESMTLPIVQKDRKILIIRKL